MHCFSAMQITLALALAVVVQDSLEAKQGTREGEEENALKRGNDKFYRFVLRAR